MEKDYLDLYPDLSRCLSNMEAAAGIDRYRFDDGAALGMRALDIYTAAGLRYTILLDRGMDIGRASFRGVPVAFVNKSGYMAKDYAMASPGGFYQYFTGGLVFTCGLENVGEICELNGTVPRMHGSRTFLSAYDVCTFQGYEDGEYTLRVKGKMRQASLFGENILLTREIISRAKDSGIMIHDIIENQGSVDYEYMLMYHINFGFPLVSPDSTIITNHEEVFFLGTKKNPEKAEYQHFSAPQKTFSELTFELHKPRDNHVLAGLQNNRLGLEARVLCDSGELPCFTEWVNLSEQDYVVGLEPGTHFPLGRKKTGEEKNLAVLKSGEKKEYTVCINVLSAVSAE
jgi:hypothetical protein